MGNAPENRAWCRSADPGLPDYPRRVLTSAGPRGWAARLRTALVLGVALLLTGCSAGGSFPEPSPSSSPAPTPAVSSPADAVSLSALGFTNGPVDRVFVPIGAQVSSRVDQPDNVAVVLTAPSVTELAAFYRRTSVANGFALTGDDSARTTLTFAGFGWTGTFTGDAQASALLLRPST